MATYAHRQRVARDAEILKLLRLGRMTNQQIAYRMDVSTKTVEKIRKEAGLPPRHRAPLTTEQRARAECLLADGTSFREAARTIGCSQDQLQRAFPRRGWTGEQKRLAEHDTEVRPHMEPMPSRRRTGRTP